MGPSEDLLRTPRMDSLALDQLMLYALESVNVLENYSHGLKRCKDLNTLPGKRVSWMGSLTATS